MNERVIIGTMVGEIKAGGCADWRLQTILDETKKLADQRDALLAALDGLLTLMHRHRWKPNADEHDPIPAALAAYYEAKKDER